MQRILIVLVLGLLAVGCGKTEPIKELTPEQKQKALRDSVVGEYESEHLGDTIKHVYLENGIIEDYWNGKKGEGEFKWSIVDGEIHIDVDSGLINILRINPEKSITWIANIYDGEREDLTKEDQLTIKKIK